MPPRCLLVRLDLPKGGNAAAVAEQVGQQDAHSLCEAGALWLLDNGELPGCSIQAGVSHQGAHLCFAGAPMHSRAAPLRAGVFSKRTLSKADAEAEAEADAGARQGRQCLWLGSGH